MKMGGGRETDYRNTIVNTEMLALHFERAQRRKIKLDEAWPSWRWLVDKVVCIKKKCTGGCQVGYQSNMEKVSLRLEGANHTGKCICSR